EVQASQASPLPPPKEGEILQNKGVGLPKEGEILLGMETGSIRDSGIWISGSSNLILKARKNGRLLWGELVMTNFKVLHKPLTEAISSAGVRTQASQASPLPPPKEGVISPKEGIPILRKDRVGS